MVFDAERGSPSDQARRLYGEPPKSRLMSFTCARRKLRPQHGRSRLAHTCPAKSACGRKRTSIKSKRSIDEACFEQLVMRERPGWTKQTECAHILRPLSERTRPGIARPSDRLGNRQQGSFGKFGDGELAAR